MKGVTFGNYHSFDDLALLLTQKILGAPTPKKESIDIPGGNGALDITEYFGEVKYDNRLLTFEFSTIVPQAEFLELFSVIQNALHGKRMKIVLDDDVEWYYIGRLEVSEWQADKNIGKLTIECDCEPFKYKASDTVITQAVSGTSTIILNNSRMRVVPKITTDAEMTVAFNGYSGVFSAGTFTIPELELIEGNNTVTVTGTGNITFTYREGGL